MNSHILFIDIYNFYHIPMHIHHCQYFNTELCGIVSPHNTAQCSVKMLMMMNAHGNVIKIFNINESSAHIHNTHPLRLIVLKDKNVFSSGEKLLTDIVVQVTTGNPILL